MSGTGQLWTTCSDQLRGQVQESTWRPWFAPVEQDGFDGATLTLSVPSAVVRDRLEERYLGLIEGIAADIIGHPVAVTLRLRATDGVAGDGGPPEGSWRDQGDAGAAGQHDEQGRHSDDGQHRDPSGRDPSGRDPNSHGRDPSDRDPSDRDHAGADHQATITPIDAEIRGTHGHRTAPTPRGAPAGGAGRGVELPSLNPRYTFDAFVIGASNRFAHAAAQRVAETPAASYNPLFIHGDSGLGKTHLLHAIGHYVIENFPTRRVRYVSTETFMNDFVEAIRNSSQATFKKRYRDCDVLLVDDIQFMEGKEGLQEEFFHTFNTLYEGAKQIVLSSDRHPRSIATLEDRLRSRFEWGLTTDVQPPELETRLAILRKKAEREHTPIPDEVLELIASNVRDNIRELEGALIRVSAFASLNRETLTRATAEMVLADILDAGRPRQITPQVILDAISAAFGFPLGELTGPKRQRPLVRARQVGMYLFRELTDYSYPAIGREFGGRDHTTVIHAFEKISGLMKEDRRTYDQVTELIFTIRGGS